MWFSLQHIGSLEFHTYRGATVTVCTIHNLLWPPLAALSKGCMSPLRNGVEIVRMAGAAATRAALRPSSTRHPTTVEHRLAGRGQSPLITTRFSVSSLGVDPPCTADRRRPAGCARPPNQCHPSQGVPVVDGGLAWPWRSRPGWAGSRSPLVRWCGRALRRRNVTYGDDSVAMGITDLWVRGSGDGDGHDQVVQRVGKQPSHTVPPVAAMS